MAVVNVYKVHYHFDQGTPAKKSSPEYIDYIQAAASDYNTLKNVLSTNSKLRAGTLVIDSVQEVGHGDNALA